MSNKTINQALKDLYTGLGGDPQALANNSTCSDYIEDLESAIKGAASGAQIDDTTASETTVFSSAKTEELIEAIPSLPSVAVGDIGEALIVESDGEGGAQWGKGAIAQNTAVFSGTISGNYPNEKLNFDNGVKLSDITSAVLSGKYVVIITPVVTFSLDRKDVNNCVFEGFFETNNTIIFYDFNDIYNQAQSSTQVSLTRRDTAMLPYVYSTDNGKILKVVDGVWTAVTP